MVLTAPGAVVVVKLAVDGEEAVDGELVAQGQVCVIEHAIEMSHLCHIPDERLVKTRRVLEHLGYFLHVGHIPVQLLVELPGVLPQTWGQNAKVNANRCDNVSRAVSYTHLTLPTKRIV